MKGCDKILKVLPSPPTPLPEREWKIESAGLRRTGASTRPLTRLGSPILSADNHPFMEYFWLCLAALAAGAVNAVAGGGTLLTFPALTSVIAPELANATSTVAVFPGSFASVWGYRRQLAGCKKWIAWLTPPSLIGGAVGACLVNDQFGAVVPWLILLASALLLLQPTIARRLKLQADAMATPGPKLLGGIVAMQLLIGVYGGYFGAGIGILMLSTLSFLGLKDIHETNALKTYLAFCVNLTAAGLFIVRGMVEWRYALAMAGAAILGGYLGARFSLLLRPVFVRWIVIVIGFSLTAYYFARELR